MRGIEINAKLPKIIATHEDAIKWGEIIMQGAQEVMTKAEGHELMPMLFGVTANKSLNICPLNMPNDRAKDKIQEIVSFFVEKTESIAIVLISDGWLKDAHNRERIGEAITGIVATSEGKMGLICAYSRNDENMPTFEAVYRVDGMQSRFLPDDVTMLPWHDMKIMPDAITH